MNATIQLQTRRILIRLCIVLALFILLSAALAASVRYRTMLATTIVNQGTISRNMNRMGTTAREVEKTVAEFKRLLPSGYGSQSPEQLLYTRLDELKSTLQLADMTVKKMENKEGVMSLGFSASLPLRNALSYSAALNRLGQIETLAFPLVSIESFILEQTPAGTAEGLQIKIEGSVQTPAPQAGAVP
jgi:hypothetical protein